ncbi:hypothetical protein, partial [Providencia rettgeri]|uniref:hypothetical protein n=1 Tax=Providencia rettgeri TaxID=587 RepID=UPI001BD1B1F1
SNVYFFLSASIIKKTIIDDRYPVPKIPIIGMLYIKRKRRNEYVINFIVCFGICILKVCLMYL